ncbi:DNA repair protein UVH3 [Striga hermonthica]|uniref:DNA repair protein UVH3 n=1 Tax=Striga hermonthica TaxID=68872 RepID=A0A9N7NF31_STRHE|nr:DNA repair protein UVH3 [Striga hermonthica]
MGVHGLWELLAPVGRRVSVETLAGKRLAIDASIWIIQFMKAMRDEKGEMVRNAHVLGFFRRICKLLYLRTKPVFVFDGGTPSLKRRTVIARRRQRENAQAKIRKTAEKLLLNQLKQMKLKELAADLEKQRQENDVKGKKPILDTPSNEKEKEKEKVNSNVVASQTQEELDAMLAASLAAEENEGVTNNASTSGAGVEDDEALFVDEEDDDEDEEMILPEMHGNVDPAVLASLPPSMQLDLLVQMRERLMAENRQKYQKVKKAPSRFSELQIESYLKTVAFRREIDGVQKAAAGKGIGGVQTSRIASEANREYIFSSSFTGDKQAFMSIGQERSEAIQSRAPPAKSSTSAVNEILSSRKSRGVAGPTAAAETGKKGFHEDVETYVDERGRVRVSRVRALGIRMTRDLQRNLDLMNEIDGDKAGTSQEKNSKSIRKKNPVDILDNAFDETLHREVTDKNNEVIKGISLEISFEDTLHNEHKNENDDDNIFARLVAGDPVKDFSQTSNPDSDNEWEEGVIENKSLREGVLAEEEDIEWEDGGFQDSELKSSYEVQRTVTKGVLEEEANIQEAIRRSLEDNMISEGGDAEIVNDDEDLVFVNEGEQEGPEIEASEVTKGALEGEDNIREALITSLEDTGSRELMSDFHDDNVISKGGYKEMVSEDENRVLVNEAEQEGSGSEASAANVRKPYSINAPELNCKGVKSAEFVEFAELNPLNENSEPAKEDGSSTSGKQSLNNLSEGGFVLSLSSAPAQEMFCAESTDHTCNASGLPFSAVDSVSGVDGVNKLANEKLYGGFSLEDEEVVRNNNEIDPEMVENNLEEEIMFLEKEREDLGSEQRKLERNSESVSNEMFVDVYKNIFDDRKYVETYFMKDIENELGLDREKLIHMALLLGSDYTEGISGIGIVNAIEVVNAFPGKDGLREFREWIESPDPTILGKLDVDSRSTSRKKGPKGGENVKSCSSNNVEFDNAGVKQIFMDKHRNVSKNWHISSSFPSDAVISAYANPQVDKSTEALAWGKPDLFVLRKLCWEKFGWGTSKADELLLPVLNEYNKRETQLRLEAFYTFNERFAKIRSKRIKKAVKDITKNKPSDLIDETALQRPVGRKKRKAKPKGDDEANQSDGAGANNDTLENATVKPTKRGRTKEKTLQTNLFEPAVRKETHARRKGKRKKNSSWEDAELCDTETDEEMQFDKSGESSLVRRSGRVRKTVNYNVSDDESDEKDNLIETPMDEDPFVAVALGSFNETNNGNNIDEEGMNVWIGGKNDSAKVTQEKTRETDKSVSADLTHGKQTDEQFLKEVSSSQDYLQFGGGFCVDEEDEGSNDKEEKIPEESDGPDLGDSLSEEENREHAEMNAGNDDCGLLDESENNDAGRHYAKSLCSMPNLRRKNKKI